jgi:hypothetical protein
MRQFQEIMQAVFRPGSEVLGSVFRRVIHGIGNGPGRPYGGNFADALDGDGIEAWIDFVNKFDLEVSDVGIHQHLVFGGAPSRNARPRAANIRSGAARNRVYR